MHVGNDSLGVCDIALELGNNDMGIGNDSACVRDIVADVGDDHIRAEGKFGLDGRLGVVTQRLLNAH